MTLASFVQRRSLFILVSFLLTFSFSRLIVFCIEHQIHVPFLSYDIIDGYHIHHFSYGIFIIVFVAFTALFIPDRMSRTWLFFLFGVSLGLIFDEFGIWLKLDPSYHQMISLIAVACISVFLIFSAFIEGKYRKIFSKKKDIEL